MTTIASNVQSPAGADASSSAGLSKQTLDYDAFLKLLVAQMQNQDPMKPMDSTEYIAQLASFSNVEQGMKLNAKLDQLLVLTSMAQANTLVGKEVISADGATSGVVESVKITEGNATAALTNGKTLTIESGMTVADA